ncbi:MAG: hypothetical protein LBS67_01705 [Clostridiales Family XIII bacterium]|jgi:transcriptional regulator with XRE-family HTH domain|nr:hypothetical protein [Clostridiales Family XIII bacterium]
MGYPDFVKQVRQLSGMTQSDCAGALSVNASSVKHWWNGYAKTAKAHWLMIDFGIKADFMKSCMGFQQENQSL